MLVCSCEQFCDYLGCVNCYDLLCCFELGWLVSLCGCLCFLLEHGRGAALCLFCSIWFCCMLIRLPGNCLVFAIRGVKLRCLFVSVRRLWI